MKKVLLAQATVIALLLAGLLYQHNSYSGTGQQVTTIQKGCYEDEIGIWMDNRTTCIATDDIMDAAEYNAIIERVDRLLNTGNATFYYGVADGQHFYTDSLR